jgi:hypothetical protein
MGDRNERGILARIKGIRRRSPVSQELQRDTNQLSARVTQLGANATTAQEGLQLEVDVLKEVIPGAEDAVKRVIGRTRQLEETYCSLALVRVAIDEGLTPSTILHLVDGVKDAVTGSKAQKLHKS